jgi:hypothetical protein
VRAPRGKRPSDTSSPHGDHISGNAYFPKVIELGQVQLQEYFSLRRPLGAAALLEQLLARKG